MPPVIVGVSVVNEAWIFFSAFVVRIPALGGKLFSFHILTGFVFTSKRKKKKEAISFLVVCI